MGLVVALKVNATSEKLLIIKLVMHTVLHGVFERSI